MRAHEIYRHLCQVAKQIKSDAKEEGSGDEEEEARQYLKELQEARLMVMSESLFRKLADNIGPWLMQNDYQDALDLVLAHLEPRKLRRLQNNELLHALTETKSWEDGGKLNPGELTEDDKEVNALAGDAYTKAYNWFRGTLPHQPFPSFLVCFPKGLQFAPSSMANLVLGRHITSSPQFDGVAVAHNALMVCAIHGVRRDEEFHLRIWIEGTGTIRATGKEVNFIMPLTLLTNRDSEEWTYSLGHSLIQWVWVLLMEVIDDARDIVLIKKNEKTKIVRREEKKANLPDAPPGWMPQSYYTIDIEERLVKRYGRRLKGRVKRECLDYRHDVRSHERVLVREGGLPIRSKERGRLVERGYVVFDVGQPTDEIAGKLKKRNLHVRKKNCWLAVKVCQVSAHQRGPEDAPYIPATYRMAGDSAS